MKKHGTTPQVQGSYVEFQTAVLRALPRDINPDEALYWRNNGALLRWVFRKALMPDAKPVGKVYPVFVDYECSVEAAVKDGCYYDINDRISGKLFPTNRKGKTELEIILFHFKTNETTHSALSGLDKIGLRPVKLLELLAFGKEYPDVQRKFRIVALGSKLKGLHPCLDVLDAEGKRRWLRLIESTSLWPSDIRFAAVYK